MPLCYKDDIVFQHKVIYDRSMNMIGISQDRQ